jgi:hypothetical protein
VQFIVTEEIPEREKWSGWRGDAERKIPIGKFFLRKGKKRCIFPFGNFGDNP